MAVSQKKRGALQSIQRAFVQLERRDQFRDVVVVSDRPKTLHSIAGRTWMRLPGRFFHAGMTAPAVSSGSISRAILADALDLDRLFDIFFDHSQLNVYGADVRCAHRLRPPATLSGEG